ncbi:MAG: conjugal transfer pilus assembly protein TraW [bacterium]|nr:MAG: conjugal transfer pilus assembly protein TraW [bacterium]KAF0150468.1 MAG: conjugal transfer pilus assembly protein TraW [bacterium]TXT32791.1 MAG: conjugal transfer pilus assembly protein TraW [Rhodocyclaceae bacterium]
MSIHAQLLAMLLFSLMPIAHAEELGVVGPTYDIAEADLLEVIQSRLGRMEKSGDLARKQGEYRDRVVGAIEKPKPVPGIKATAAKRTYFIDPTWTLDRDIRGADGALLFARGLKVNPLDHVSLREKLVFFDGRDRRQVSFARQLLRNQDRAVKPILVAGEPLNLMRDWKRRVFYDQGGTLVRRLGIHQVPAVVTQDGKRLRVDEVLP